MITKDTIIRGLKSGCYITWDLAKIVIPVFFAVTFLKYTPVLPFISRHMAGIMQVVGLPGEAALPLLLGYFLNIYAAIGALLPLSLSYKQITIMAAMLMLAHSLPMELAINKKTGVKVKGLLLIRLVLSVASGVLINWLM
jgi:spore maturation protein SpmB